MPDRDPEQLAAKLAAFDGLTAAQLAMVSELVDRACAREREAVAEAFHRALPLLPRAVLRELLGEHER